jgi:hypothetical protein
LLRLRSCARLLYRAGLGTRRRLRARLFGGPLHWPGLRSAKLLPGLLELLTGLLEFLPGLLEFLPGLLEFLSRLLEFLSRLLDGPGLRHDARLLYWPCLGLFNRPGPRLLDRSRLGLLDRSSLRGRPEILRFPAALRVVLHPILIVPTGLARRRPLVAEARAAVRTSAGPGLIVRR